MRVELLRMTRFRTAVKKLLLLASAGAACSVLSWTLAPSATENAVANGDTRTIHFYHTHTGESIDATFRVDGHYDQAVLDKLNYFLRDWRNNDQIHMDPRLFDTLWEVYRTAGADQPIQIFSAYRSPETNAMLRRRSRAVAEHSQHMLGKAMDTTMPGMSMEQIREIAMKMQRGGVGYYQAANFVHIDVGGVRSWPRMSYDNLARLFPDGKTVHIPANGQPMARYEEARAEIAARGGTELPPAQQSTGFFAWLFGGPSDASREDAAPARAQPSAVAYANNTEGDEGAVVAGPTPARRAPVQTAAPTPAPQTQPVAVAALQRNDAPAAQPEAAESEAIDRVIPLPPRRPADMVAMADDMLPLPPTRPGATFHLQLASADASDLPMPVARPAPDAIGGLITSSAGVPMLRKSALPAIITQGSGETRHLPTPALAFAATESSVSLRPGVHETIVRAATPRGLALRAVTALRGEPKGPKPLAAASIAPVAALAGPSIYGLRRAAHLDTRAAL
jgi:uncharacterized protein YcbK (DUF882 family)